MDNPAVLVFLALAVGGLWFMNSRAKKQQRAQSEFRDNLQVGQEVMTGSGMFGTITAVDGDRITIESTPGASSQWLRAAIAKLVEPEVPELSVAAEGAAADDGEPGEPGTEPAPQQAPAPEDTPEGEPPHR